MEGARFVRVLARRADLRYPFPPDFAERLEGKTVVAVRRRAKYLLLELSSGDLLMMHLGMSGDFRVEGRLQRAAYYHERDYLEERREGVPVDKHDHVVFEMSSGQTVVFNDPRRFGFMKILLRGGEWGVGGGELGPEPLDRSFTGRVLAGALKGKKTSLKAALLDQRVVAGLGNIYVSEALHRAGLSPKRKASTLATKTGEPTPKAEALVTAIKDTLRDAIKRHHRVSGDDRFLVYDRDGERCPRRGCRGTVARITQGARSTFYCQTCQR